MATIVDVAARAGVGVGTVSRVLNGQAGVSHETRRRVEAAMAALDYRPSPLAQGLKRGRTHRIAVVVSFFTSPSAVERLRGLSAVLGASPYEIVLYPVDLPDQRAAHMDTLAGPHSVDGVLVVSLPPTAEEAARFQRTMRAVVLVDAAHPVFPSVLTDDVAGGRMAAAHLVDLGHRAIAFVGDDPDNPFGFTSSAHRLRGLRETLAAAGLTLPPEWIRTGPHGEPDARRMTHDLLAGPERPTAVFAASDTQALGAFQAARDLGIRVPEELSIIGFDDIAAARHAGLTTVHQPLEESGRLAAELLLARLADQTSGPEEVLLDLQLIRRGTTGPPA